MRSAKSSRMTWKKCFFYTLLDLSCRIFLCEIGDDLRQMAIDSGETNTDEFNRVRSFS